jgi:integrase/recombinase XerD
MLKKQAKILSEQQIKAVLSFLETTRNPKRDKVIFMLSIYAGLRAKEISNLELSMITDALGNIADVISLEDKATKGRSGRTIPMNKTLKAALIALLNEPQVNRSRYVISTERAQKFSANGIAVWFQRLYRSLGFKGASSHSGRRYFGTHCARKIGLVGGSLKDVQYLLGHSWISSTQRYLQENEDAQKQVVNIIN